MALSKNIQLDDNPAAVVGAGNPHGVPLPPYRVCTRRIRAATAASDTLVSPFKVGHITGLLPGTEDYTLVHNDQGGTTVTFTGMGAGPYTDRIIKLWCLN